MNTIEKRDYIHSHLHKLDEELVHEMYIKIRARLDKDDPIIGYDATQNPIRRSQLVKDINESEEQIKKGEYLTIDELEKESETW